MATGVLDPTEVQIGTSNGPGIYIAPPGTPGPTDTEMEWPAAWHVLGYLSDDGPTIGQSTDTEDITPWQSVVPIRSIITSRAVTLQFVLWQLNRETLGLYFDTPAVENGGGSFAMDVRTDSPQQLYAAGIDSADADRVLRIIFPRCSLTDAGDMQIQRGAAIPLDCTLSALEDNGILAHIMIGETGEDTRAAGTAYRRTPTTSRPGRGATGTGGAGSERNYTVTRRPSGLAQAEQTAET
ncbi:MAG: hypothetical protein LBQ06_05890 [Frankiaceae bacterium]|jgi:hypothetical protein|nr:hypothetical protein [Frankiaceae bacterium]